MHQGCMLQNRRSDVMVSGAAALLFVPVILQKAVSMA